MALTDWTDLYPSNTAYFTTPGAGTHYSLKLPVAGGDPNWVRDAVDAWRVWPGNVDGNGKNLSNLGDLSFAAGKRITQDAWAALTLANSWVTYGAPALAPSYYLGKEQTLRIEGLIKSGTFASGTQLFALPAGFRPRGLVIFSCPYSTNGADVLHCEVQISGTGEALVYGCTGNGWLSLSGISFRIA